MLRLDVVIRKFIPVSLVLPFKLAQSVVRRGPLFLLSVLLIHSAVSDAQQERVLVLSPSGVPYQKAFQGLQAYVRRQSASSNIQVLWLDENRVREAIGAVRQANPNVVVTFGSAVTKVIAEGIHDRPIVAGMVFSFDDVAKNTNLTGVVLDHSIHTQLAYIKKIAPSARTIGILYNPNQNRRKVENIAAAASQVGLEVAKVEANAPQQIPLALDTVLRRADLLLGIADNLVMTPQTAKGILLASFQKKVPLVGLSTSWVQAGALYALDWDYGDIGAQCGQAVLSLLKGARASTIPVAMPRKVEYSVNLKTVNALKVDVPAEVIRSAHQVFQ